MYVITVQTVFVETHGQSDTQREFLELGIYFQKTVKTVRTGPIRFPAPIPLYSANFFLSWILKLAAVPTIGPDPETFNILDLDKKLEIIFLKNNFAKKVVSGHFVNKGCIFGLDSVKRGGETYDEKKWLICLTKITEF